MREGVRQFAEVMERKLQKHDADWRWDGCSERYLFRRLLEEVAELFDEMNETTPALGDGDEYCVVLEAADVANYAMMIADVYRQRAQRSQRASG